MDTGKRPEGKAQPSKLATATTRAISVQADGTDVIIYDPTSGAVLACMPWQAAMELARAIATKSHEAAQIWSAEQTILDGAILARSGASVGITNNPDLQAEINKAAANDPLIRKHMGVSAGDFSVAGTPTVKRQGD